MSLNRLHRITDRFPARPGTGATIRSPLGADGYKWLYAGGRFRYIGRDAGHQVEAHRVARWNGRWSPLGEALTDPYHTSPPVPPDVRTMAIGTFREIMEGGVRGKELGLLIGGEGITQLEGQPLNHSFAAWQGLGAGNWYHPPSFPESVTRLDCMVRYRMPRYDLDVTGARYSDGVAFKTDDNRAWFISYDTGLVQLGTGLRGISCLYVLPRGAALPPAYVPLTVDRLLSADLSGFFQDYYPPGGAFPNSWVGNEFGRVFPRGNRTVSCMLIHPVWGLIVGGEIRKGAGYPTPGDAGTDRRLWYNGIARFNPNATATYKWGPLNRAATSADPADLWSKSGLFNCPYTLALHRNEIVAGGDIWARQGSGNLNPSTPTEDRMHNICRFRETGGTEQVGVWESLGGGFPQLYWYLDHTACVITLAVLDDDLYVGGRFAPETTQPAGTCSGIARWTGTRWDNLHGGTPYDGAYPQEHWVTSLTHLDDLQSEGANFGL